MPDEGPRRLKQGSDTPQELLRALAALRKGVDDSARLERVGHRLGSVLDAAPPAAAGAAGAAAPKLGIGMLKLLVAAAGLLVPLLYFQPWNHFGSQSRDDQTVQTGPAQVPGAGVADRAAEPVNAAAPQPQPALDGAEQVAPARAHEAVEQSPAPSRRRGVKPGLAAGPRAHAKRGAHAQRTDKASGAHTESLARAAAGARDSEALASQQAAASAQQPLAAASEAETTRAARSAAEPPTQPAAAAALEPKPKPAPEKPEKAARVPSEAELLLQARQALKRDASLSLRLVAEHEARYPKGRLTPEREVLAIEALRNLGRTHEADARLQRFEARYPNSIHLQRLHGASR